VCVCVCELVNFIDAHIKRVCVSDMIKCRLTVWHRVCWRCWDSVVWWKCHRSYIHWTGRDCWWHHPVLQCAQWSGDFCLGSQVRWGFCLTTDGNHLSFCLW